MQIQSSRKEYLVADFAFHLVSWILVSDPVLLLDVPRN
jgi:hypothetical protein